MEKNTFYLPLDPSERELINQLRELTTEQQNATIWFMRCLEFLELLDSGRIMTEEEEQAWMERAKEENDQIWITLIHFKKLKDQQRQ